MLTWTCSSRACSIAFLVAVGSLLVQGGTLP
jgi:hypothetical protein